MRCYLFFCSRWRTGPRQQWWLNSKLSERCLKCFLLRVTELRKIAAYKIMSHSVFDRAEKYFISKRMRRKHTNDTDSYVCWGFRFGTLWVLHWFFSSSLQGSHSVLWLSPLISVFVMVGRTVGSLSIKVGCVFLMYNFVSSVDLKIKCTYN